MFISVVTLVRFLLTALALVLAGMALSIWNRRKLAPEARALTLLTLSAAIYCFGYAGEITQSTLAGTLFWLHVEYFGIPWIPALWLLVARNQKGLRSRYGLIFAVPVLTFAGELTNSLHGLYDRSIYLVQRGPFWVAATDRGPIAWLYIAYLNVALLYGAWIYLSSSSREWNRIQIWTLVAASLAPWGGHILYTAGWSPWGLDLAPMSLGASVILAYIAILHFGCFDLVPKAHSLIFNNMRDAALVTDLRHRLVEFNAAALNLFPSLANARPGDDPARVLREVPALVNTLLGVSVNQRITIKSGEEERLFDVRVIPLYRDQWKTGEATILADVTSQMRLVHDLQERAETDSLTGLANRHCLMTAIEREYARAIRHRELFSVAVVDVDQFKAINDNMGHHAGDTVLLAVTGRILHCLRASDLLCRYGGDEFVILLPMTGMEGAREVAERIREAVSGPPMQMEDQTVQVSVSLGVASLTLEEDGGWEQLLQQADKALYDAKRLGKNRVEAWTEALRTGTAARK